MPRNRFCSLRIRSGYFTKGLLMSTMLQQARPLIIDRSFASTRDRFIGDDHTIWRGPTEGNGLGDGDEIFDIRSLQIGLLGPSRIFLASCLREDEDAISGIERLNRLHAMKREYILPDWKIGKALFQESNHATLEAMRNHFHVEWFDIPGAVFRNSRGVCSILYLYYNGLDWNRNFAPLTDSFGRSERSLLIKVNP